MLLFVFGIVLSVGGYLVVVSGTAKGGFPVFEWVGPVVILAGLVFAIYGLIQLLPRQSDPPLNSLICPKCESVYSFLENEKHFCPHDMCELEPLEGYYARHPERRDKPITPNKT